MKYCCEKSATKCQGLKASLNDTLSKCNISISDCGDLKRNQDEEKPETYVRTMCIVKMPVEIRDRGQTRIQSGLNFKFLVRAFPNELAITVTFLKPANRHFYKLLNL